MKKMASFITLFLLLPCIVLGILLFWGFGLPAQYEETFLGEMKYKMDRLKETASLSEASSSPVAFRRVILVGGSSIPLVSKLPWPQKLCRILPLWILECMRTWEL